MMQFWKTLPAAAKVIIVVLVLLILYLIYLKIEEWIVRQGKKTDVDWENVPLTGSSSSGDQKQWNPTPLAKDLYESMDGVNVPSPLGDARQEPLSRLANLQTDDMVKAVHNEFVDISGGGDLYEWIDSEWVSGSLIPTWSKAKARLKDAGLGPAQGS